MIVILFASFLLEFILCVEVFNRIFSKICLRLVLFLSELNLTDLSTVVIG